MNRFLLISLCFFYIQLQAQKYPVKVDTIQVGHSATFVCKWYKVSLIDLANEGYTLAGPLKDTLFSGEITMIYVSKNYKHYFKICVKGSEAGKEVTSTNYMMKNYKEYLNRGIGDFILDEIGTTEIKKTWKHKKALKP